MATFRKRGKKWCFKYYDAAGKQRWVTGYTDKSETVRLANRMENQKTAILRGDIDPQAEVRKIERAKLVTEHIEAYETHLKAKGCNKWHVSYTIADIRACFTHAVVSHASGLQRRHVDAWVMELRKADAPRTINRRVGAVQAFLRHLKEAGALSDYVLYRYPKQKVQGTDRRKRRALTRAECEAILKHAPEVRRQVYRFALLTGFRHAEIGSMTPANVNFDAGTVTVRANDAKNKNKDQTIPLAAALVEMMKKVCKGKGREEKIFEVPRREDAAKLLRQDCKAAEVDTTHVDFHCLRHTFITRLAESLVHPKILQELARHSSIETTLRYYTHFRQADERNAINGMPTLAEGDDPLLNVTPTPADKAA
jgi:integrase